MKTMDELIAVLEEDGDGCGLISDDAGYWAVSTSGMQNAPDDPPQDISTSFFVEAAEWKPTIREALEAYYEEHLEVPHPIERKGK